MVANLPISLLIYLPKTSNSLYSFPFLSGGINPSNLCYLPKNDKRVPIACQEETGKRRRPLTGLLLGMDFCEVELTQCVMGRGAGLSPAETLAVYPYS